MATDWWLRRVLEGYNTLDTGSTSSPCRMPLRW